MLRVMRPRANEGVPFQLPGGAGSEDNEGQFIALAKDLALTPHAGDFVRSVVVADYPAEGDAVEALRRAILCEYADTVFNSAMERPPPVREPMG